MIGSLGWQELLIILVILALLFGASRVSDLGGALGRGIREFRSEARGEDDDSPDDGDAPTPKDSSDEGNGGG
jgi:sec-independent protein translocase protein TatA